jgi:CRP/FNR family transcriptional regulator, cyclic AMP receptor protein
MALLDNQPRSASVMAMEDSTLLVLHRADFRRHLERYPDACFAIMQELCHRIRKADAIIGSLALLDVYGRVAHMLLDLAKTDGEQTEDGVVIKDRPTQQNIAAMVGTSRETVSRALSEFQRRGYLEMDGRTIHIYNFAALEEDFMRS